MRWSKKLRRMHLGYFISYWALGLGSLITVLFAPQSGDETRAYVSRKAKDTKDYAQRKAQEIQERAETLLEKGKKTIGTKKERISAAVDAGRKAYKQEIANGKATGID